MVQRILVTYDSTVMGSVLAIMAAFNNDGAGSGVNASRVNNISRKLIESLHRNGVEVVEFRDKLKGNGGGANWFGDELVALAKESDLVLHDPRRIMPGVEYNTADIFRQQANNAIRCVGLQKTHLEDHKIAENKKATLDLVNQADPAIQTPRTWTVKEFFESSNHTYPVLFKGRFGSMGDQVTRINNVQEALTILSRIDSDAADFQEMIKTPSDHFTSYRIFTLGDGTIQEAVMNVSGRKKSEGGRAVTSNVATGGHQIPIYPIEKDPKLSPEDAQVLIDHSINPDQIELPTKLKEQAGKVAKIFARNGLVWGGQDWLQDSKGDFYFLEMNPHPGYEMYRTLYMNGEAHPWDDSSEMNVGLDKLAKALKKYKPVQ